VKKGLTATDRRPQAAVQCPHDTIHQSKY
jgi:hypothetical protein